MSRTESLESVIEFLEKVRNILTADDCNFSIQRTRNNEDPLNPNTTQNTLLTLGYDDEDLIEAIVTLNQSDYSETVPDIKRSGTPDFWVFEKIIDGRSIYVKFKIRDEVNKIIFCMSFHFATKPFVSKPYA